MMNTERTGRLERGFTLTEIAIVLVIIGLLITGAVKGLGTFREVSKYNETQAYLERARDALLAYAAVNKHLPCPDTSGNGVQNRDVNDEQCDEQFGQLPYVDLALPADTPWFAPAFYGVNEQADDDDCGSAEASNEGQCFFWPKDPYFNLDTDGNAGDLSLKDFNNDDLASKVQAIVGSYGENPVALDDNCRSIGRSDEEDENCDGDEDYVMDNYREGEFDDQLVWIDELALKALWLERASVDAASDPSGGMGFPDSEGNGPENCDGLDNCTEGSDKNDNDYGPQNGGNGTMHGTDGDDTILGHDGHDRFEAGDGDDTVYGGKGNDEIWDGGGNDRLYGGDGNDLIILNNSFTDTESVDGGSGNDQIDLEVDCTGRNVTYQLEGASEITLPVSNSRTRIGTAEKGILRVEGNIRAFFINMEYLRAYTHGGGC